MSAKPRLYAQVAEYLKERIHKGVIRPNSRMPSERVLAEQFGVSRVTVRQALKELESAGLVVVDGDARLARWSGGFSDQKASAESIEEGATGLVSFSDLAASNGLTATSVVLSNVTRPSSLDEADLLGIAPGAPVVDLVRLRQLDGIPTLIDYSLLPEFACPWRRQVGFRPRVPLPRPRRQLWAARGPGGLRHRGQGRQRGGRWPTRPVAGRSRSRHRADDVRRQWPRHPMVPKRLPRRPLSFSRHSRRFGGCAAAAPRRRRTVQTRAFI